MDDYERIHFLGWNTRTGEDVQMYIRASKMWDEKWLFELFRKMPDGWMPITELWQQELESRLFFYGHLRTWDGLKYFKDVEQEALVRIWTDSIMLGL